MKLRFTKASNDDVSGASLQSILSAPFEVLRTAFGEPERKTIQGSRTDVMWSLKFEDGTVAMIYDYKTGKNCLGDKGVAAESNHDWHISGFSTKAALVVAEALGCLGGDNDDEEGRVNEAIGMIAQQVRDQVKAMHAAQFADKLIMEVARQGISQHMHGGEVMDYVEAILARRKNLSF